MSNATITIASRFRGPPHSANGGYAAGRLAACVGDRAEVTLRAPPPLDTPLRVVDCPDRSVALYHGERLVAEAKATEVDIEPFDVPDSETVEAASRRTFPAERHGIPGCFVCGPARDPGDGLRIHAGPVAADDADWAGDLAAPWRPGEDLAGDDGRVRAEFLWAALDCPTAYACGSATGFPPVLLGRQSVAIRERPAAGEALVVMARRRGRDGRKYFAEAGLYRQDGTELAVCRAVWIEVDPAIIAGRPDGP